MNYFWSTRAELQTAVLTQSISHHCLDHSGCEIMISVDENAINILHHFLHLLNYKGCLLCFT